MSGRPADARRRRPGRAAPEAACPAATAGSAGTASAETEAAWVLPSADGRRCTERWTRGPPGCACTGGWCCRPRRHRPHDRCRRLRHPRARAVQPAAAASLPRGVAVTAGRSGQAAASPAAERGRRRRDAAAFGAGAPGLGATQAAFGASLGRQASRPRSSRGGRLPNRRLEGRRCERRLGNGTRLSGDGRFGLGFQHRRCHLGERLGAGVTGALRRAARGRLLATAGAARGDGGATGATTTGAACAGGSSVERCGCRLGGLDRLRGRCGGRRGLDSGGDDRHHAGFRRRGCVGRHRQLVLAFGDRNRSWPYDLDESWRRQ